jgi:hypothetical protein
MGLLEDKQQLDFDPAYGFVISDIEWKAAGTASAHLPWAIVNWFPIKDREVRHKKHPMCISRRHAGLAGSDPQCVYDALRQAWQIRAAEVPQAEWHRTAFFSSAAGKIYDTKTVRDIARAIAAILHIPEKEVGGTSFRIGGASDLRESHGDAEATRLLKERGRWMSDIANIYSRMSASTHLSASRAMTFAPGQDMERLTGWAQQPY